MIKTVCVSLLAICVVGCGPSGPEYEEAKKACAEFIGSEMNAYDTKVFDLWSKGGAIVMDVGYKAYNSHSSSYSIRKCIYDKSQGRIGSPSPLNDSEWRK